jgi:hypothetical protein
MLRTNSLLLLSLLITACVDTETAPGSPPHPPSQLIKAVEFHWGTHQRKASGSDNWPITWVKDGHQYTAWGGSGDFGGSNRKGRVSLGVARVEGGAETYQGHDIWSGHRSANAADFGGKFYALLMVDDTLYMWVSRTTPGISLKGHPGLTDPILSLQWVACLTAGTMACVCVSTIRYRVRRTVASRRQWSFAERQYQCGLTKRSPYSNNFFRRYQHVEWKSPPTAFPRDAKSL